ncbi:FKBP-type peptidyl-prolyl cis-trans isomerase [Rickettsia endosymbiont of Culicoides newsteadi]|uniref:FKBP-type peptidyl-prolyl cis-trans isomerase n=1 Tax=Rickettsia endosymbiont of Culicoides newsteadi TaxID=1961830 RepID=UPI000B9ACB0F|nr:FKBP-type peptidyl-prolyl cis-trans isomerase [Rickettsia endosymbiont of Culicoides newsteadi]OZG32381.1 peptidyl-prolyl cis-trans isomerase [Rickettsia endosymbiont of Culicoides newsteadi]
MQKALTFIIAAAIIYSIVQMKMQSPPEENAPKVQTTEAESNNNTSTPEQANIPLTGNFLEKTVSKVLINALKTEEGRLFFENLLQPTNKPIADGKYTIEVNRDLIQPMFKINTFGNGTIGPATCGHVVTLHYRLLDINNNLLSENTKTFTLGSRAIMPGIDSVVVGMMVGQTRQAIFPTKYTSSNEENKDYDPPYRVNIVLNSILPNNFVNSNEVKIFDDEIAYRMPLLCGDKVGIDAKITKLSNGQVLYDSTQEGKKLDIKIGDINYPLIVSYALHGKVPVGTRTVIAKGKLFKALGSNINKMLNQSKIPVDEYLMLELTNFQTD